MFDLLSLKSGKSSNSVLAITTLDASVTTFPFTGKNYRAFRNTSADFLSVILEYLVKYTVETTESLVSTNE